MLAGIFDSGEGAYYSLVICDFLVEVERNIEINLMTRCQNMEPVFAFRGKADSERTRINTLLPFKSRSVIASLFDRDIVYVLQ